MKLRAGQADYFLGTCHTGAGASLGVLVGLMGQAACHTFGRGVPTEEERSAPCWRTARRCSASPWTRSTGSRR
ncbi:DUF2620 family protein [Streptomyces sp. KL116D]|uniref:DUF2620 family protein n=1 Tax=Streptomyces sp. KL116D TaxID=3045152 RepID=UPI00355879EC